MNDNYIYSRSPLHTLSGNVTGAHLYMEVNVPCGGVQPFNIYANSAEAAAAYLCDYARYIGVGHWSINIVNGGCSFSPFEGGNYEFEKKVREFV